MGAVLGTQSLKSCRSSLQQSFVEHFLVSEFFNSHASRVENTRSDRSLVDIRLGIRQVTSVRFGLVLFPVAESSDKLGVISLPPLERLLVGGEPTGMMTSDKRRMVLFLELSLRPTTDSHLRSGNGGRID
jgi:hypothetical protein